MSKPKTKPCWIVRDKHGIVMSTVTPKWISGNFPQTYEAHADSVPPLLRKMWKEALKGKRGKNAIVECDWETWRPIIEVKCPTPYCKNGMTDWIEIVECRTCKGTGKIKRPMETRDL